MATTIKMPQLGESVTEGTIERWLVKEGDTVEQYDPLFEVVTDKVNAEVPAEVAGTIRRSWCPTARPSRSARRWPRSTPRAGAGASEALAAEARCRGARPPEAPAQAETPADAGDAARRAAGAGPRATAEAATAPAGSRRRSPRHPPSRRPAARTTTMPSASNGDGSTGTARMTPAVRRLVREHGIDVAQLRGSGAGGRVTRDDVLAFIEKGPSAPAQEAPQAEAGRARPAGRGPRAGSSGSAPASRRRAPAPAPAPVPSAVRRRHRGPALADAQGHREEDDPGQADRAARVHRGRGRHDQRRELARGEQRRLQGAGGSLALVRGGRREGRDRDAPQAPDR